MPRNQHAIALRVCEFCLYQFSRVCSYLPESLRLLLGYKILGAIADSEPKIRTMAGSKSVRRRPPALGLGRFAGDCRRLTGPPERQPTPAAPGTVRLLIPICSHRRDHGSHESRGSRDLHGSNFPLDSNHVARPLQRCRMERAY